MLLRFNSGEKVRGWPYKLVRAACPKPAKRSFDDVILIQFYDSPSIVISLSASLSRSAGRRSLFSCPQWIDFTFHWIRKARFYKSLFFGEGKRGKRNREAKKRGTIVLLVFADREKLVRREMIKICKKLFSSNLFAENNW